MSFTRLDLMTIEFLTIIILLVLSLNCHCFNLCVSNQHLRYANCMFNVKNLLCKISKSDLNH